MKDRTCSIDGCVKAAKQRGWCWMHYYRWRHHGDVNYIGRVVYGPAEYRFWSKVDKNGAIPEYRPDLGPCWIWTASTNDGGYGTRTALRFSRTDGLTVASSVQLTMAYRSIICVGCMLALTTSAISNRLRILRTSGDRQSITVHALIATKVMRSPQRIRCVVQMVGGVAGNASDCGRRPLDSRM